MGAYGGTERKAVWLVLAEDSLSRHIDGLMALSSNRKGRRFAIVVVGLTVLSLDGNYTSVRTYRGRRDLW